MTRAIQRRSFPIFHIACEPFCCKAKALQQIFSQMLEIAFFLNQPAR